LFVVAWSMILCIIEGPTKDMLAKLFNQHIPRITNSIGCKLCLPLRITVEVCPIPLANTYPGSVGRNHKVMLALLIDTNEIRRAAPLPRQRKRVFLRQ
jgi:hypothetical protein